VTSRNGRSRVPAAAVASVLCVLIAGCGSSGSNANAPEPAQYRAKANAVCRLVAKKALPFPGKRSGKGLVTTAKLVGPYLEKSLGLERDALRRLRALAAPSSQKKAVDDFVAAQAGRIFDLQQALDAANAGDARGFQTAFQNDQKLDGPRYLRAARTLGLSDCVRKQ
jgi:hypothetical protein